MIEQLLSLIGKGVGDGRKKKIRSHKKKTVLEIVVPKTKRGRKTTLYNKSHYGTLTSGTRHRAPVRAPKHHYRVEEHNPTAHDIEATILKLKRKPLGSMIPIIDLTKHYKKHKFKPELKHEHEMKIEIPELEMKRERKMPPLEAIPEESLEIIKHSALEHLSGEGTGHRYISGLTLERQLKNYIRPPVGGSAPHAPY